MVANLSEWEQRLGELAMAFRACEAGSRRKSIAAEYSDTVDKLIRTGQWVDIPAPEDMLPDEDMPKFFFDYWMKKYPARG